MENTELHYKKMTQTPVAQLVIKLGIPTAVAMLITSFYNMADTYFVGTLGETPQGAIGILFTLQSIIQAVAYMLGHGSGTYVAKELADKNVKRASVYVSSAFFLGGTAGIVFAVVGLAALEPFMRLLGSTETILPYAKDYGMWVLISCPFLICSLILNNNLRYEGKAFFAMIGLCSGAVLNIFGDWLLVSVVGLGVFGAGLSTAVSQTVSFFILLAMHAKNAQAKISVKHVSREVKIFLQVFRTGFPSFVRQTLNSVSGGILNNLAGYYGGLQDVADQTITAMSIVNRVSNFVMCLGMGICQGLQPVASFNWEAGKHNRAKQALKVTMLICFVCVAFPAVFIAVFPYAVVRLFQSQSDVVAIAAPALRYAMLGTMFMPLFIPVNMLFQSIRKAEVASFLAMLRSGLAFIPLLYIFTYLWGIFGIQIAQPISDIVTALINIPFVIWFLKKDFTVEPEPQR